MVSQPLPETDENYHNHNVTYHRRVAVNYYKLVRLQFSRPVWCSQDLHTFVKCHTALCCARCFQVLFATVHCVYIWWGKCLHTGWNIAESCYLALRYEGGLLSWCCL